MVGERLAAALPVLNSLFYLSFCLSPSLAAFSGIRISSLWLSTLTSTNWFATQDVFDTAADSARAGQGVMQGRQTQHCRKLPQ